MYVSSVFVKIFISGKMLFYAIGGTCTRNCTYQSFEKYKGDSNYKDIIK